MVAEEAGREAGGRVGSASATSWSGIALDTGEELIAGDQKAYQCRRRSGEGVDDRRMQENLKKRELGLVGGPPESVDYEKIGVLRCKSRRVKRWWS